MRDLVRLFEILVFILTLISSCRRMSSGLSQVAVCQLHRIRRSVPSFAYQLLVVALVLSRLDYGNATWLTSWPACLTVSSVYSTRQLGRSPVFVARSILQMLSPVFTGSEHPSAWSSNWRSLSTELLTALHLSTCQTGYSTSLICRRDVEAGCIRRPPVFSTSARRGVSLSAIARLLLLTHGSGTVNNLPPDVQSVPSLTTFRQKLKPHLSVCVLG